MSDATRKLRAGKPVNITPDLRLYPKLPMEIGIGLHALSPDGRVVLLRERIPDLIDALATVCGCDNDDRDTIAAILAKAGDE